MADRPLVRIITDGACSGNPGPGGWACIIRTGEDALEHSGGEESTTNNRMEMMAALRGLEALPESSQVELTTDSQYLKNGITTWIHGWMRKGWRTASGEAVKNEDLWRDLWEESGRHKIEWRWVRGHTGHADNERCDRLAVAAVERARLGDTQMRREQVGQTPAPTPAVRRKEAAPPLPVEGRNVEVKLYCRSLEDVKRRAGTLGGKLQPRLSQEDQFFISTEGLRVKLRRETLHMPEGTNAQRAELIRYQRKDEAGARLSSYTREEVLDASSMQESLAASHRLGLLVSKSREVVLLGRTRLHLDRVAGLGFFVELECVLRPEESEEDGRAELQRLMRALGLEGLPVEARSYADLLALAGA